MLLFHRLTEIKVLSEYVPVSFINRSYDSVGKKIIPLSCCVSRIVYLIFSSTKHIKFLIFFKHTYVKIIRLYLLHFVINYKTNKFVKIVSFRYVFEGGSRSKHFHAHGPVDILSLAFLE